MRRLVSIILIFILFALSTACAGTSGNKLIEPGDKVGDFTITTGIAGNFSYGFEVQCTEPAQGNLYTCNASVGQAINVSTGLYDTTGSGKLDEVWANSNYQMYINDRLVDLQAFGTIDYSHPQVGTIRFGNVVIVTDKPGKITVRDSGLFDNGDPFSSTSTYVFSQP